MEKNNLMFYALNSFSLEDGLSEDDAARYLQEFLGESIVLSNSKFSWGEPCAMCQQPVTKKNFGLVTNWDDGWHISLCSECYKKADLLTMATPPHGEDLVLFNRAGVPEFSIFYSDGGYPYLLVDPSALLANSTDTAVLTIFWQFLIYTAFAPVYLYTFKSRVWFILRALLLSAANVQGIANVLNYLPPITYEVYNVQAE